MFAAADCLIKRTIAIKVASLLTTETNEVSEVEKSQSENNYCKRFLRALITFA